MTEGCESERNGHENEDVVPGGNELVGRVQAGRRRGGEQLERRLQRLDDKASVVVFGLIGSIDAGRGLV